MAYRQFPRKIFYAELLGSFTLVGTIFFGGEVVGGFSHALLIALVLAIIIYWAAPYSKAHFNPAVTLAFYIRKEISGKLAGIYLLSEVLGALFAVLLYNWFIGLPMVTPIENISISILLAEFAGTALLVGVIMAVATLQATRGNKYYGVAIALSVMLSILLFGEISGSHINPIVSMVKTIEQSIGISLLFAYLGIQFLAAIVISLCFNLVFGKSFNETLTHLT